MFRGHGHEGGGEQYLVRLIEVARPQRGSQLSEKDWHLRGHVAGDGRKHQYEACYLLGCHKGDVDGDLHAGRETEERPPSSSSNAIRSSWRE